jgi:hypothetical protein
MTFYEAAVEVLRRRQQPLHYKKITDLAIEEDLLSHIGRTPQRTMFERLKKSVHEKGDDYLEQKVPGVYKLQTGVVDDLNEEAKQRHRKEKKRLKKRKKLRKSRYEKDKADDTAKNLQSPTRIEDYDSYVSSSPVHSGDTSGESGDEFGENLEFKATDLVDGTIDLGELPQAAYKVLREADAPLHINALSDRIFSRKLAEFQTHDEPATIQAALATDNQIRITKGHRPLFTKYDESRWGLTEWGLQETDRKREQTILSLAKQIQESTLNQLGENLRDIQAESFEQIAIFLLRQMGYENIDVAERTDRNDVYLSADYHRGVHETRVCIEIKGSSKFTLTKSHVEEFRDNMDQYSASQGLLIHLGDIADSAVEATETTDSGKSIDLLDVEALVQLLFRHEVGIKSYKAPIYFIDRSFIEGLEISEHETN